MSDTFMFKRVEQYLNGYFDRSLAQIMNVFLMVIIFFAGKFSFDRLIDDTLRTRWLEVRLWALGALIVSLLFGFYKNPDKLKGQKLGWLFWFFCAALLVFQSYFVGNLFYLGNILIFQDILYDVVIFLVSFLALIFVFREEKDFILLCKQIQILGFLFFLMALVGVGNPELNGSGWAPFGGPITFYRIEFFVFCASMYLAIKSDIKSEKWVHNIIAATALYSTFASLSKAASLAGILSIGYCFYFLLCRREYKKAIFLCLLVSVVSVLFSQIKGRTLVSRIHVITDLGKADMATGEIRSSFIPNDIKEIFTNQIEFNSLNESQQDRMRLLGNYFSDVIPDFLADFPSFMRTIDRYVVLHDGSARLRMWANAYDLFKHNKWFGGGVGNYSFIELNYYKPSGQERYTYPHNLLFELLATTGFTGLLLFSIAFLAFLVLFGQALISFPFLVFFQGYLVFFMLSSMFAGDLLDFKLLWWVGSALIASHLRNKLSTV